MEKKINKGGGDDNVELQKIVSIFFANWKVFAISIIVCLFLVFLFIAFSTPKYYIHAKILVEDDENSGASMLNSSGSMLKDFGGLFNQKSNVDNEADIVQTRDLMSKVVRQLSLNIEYYQGGPLKGFELYKTAPFLVIPVNIEDSVGKTEFAVTPVSTDKFTLYDSKADLKVAGKFGDTLKVEGVGAFAIQKTSYPFNPEESYSVVINSVDAAIYTYLAWLDVRIPNKQVTTIDLQLQSSIPEKGEDVLNALISAYIKGNLDEKNKIADSTLKFISERLDSVKDELNGVEKTVQYFKQTNNIADLEEQSKLLLDNSSDFYKQLNQVDVQIQVAGSMLKYLKDPANSKRVVPSLLANTDPSFAGLFEKYNALQVQRDALSLSNTENNPVVKNLNGQINNLRTDLINNLTNQFNALQISRDKLVKENSNIRGEINKVPSKERQFLDLSRQQEMKQNLYLYLLQKKEETAISKAANIPTVRMIDSPKSEIEPFSPQKPLLLVAGLFVGTVLPFAFIIAKRSINNKVSSRDDLENGSSIPICGEINHHRGKTNLIVKDNSRSPISEQFRAIRTNLKFIIRNVENPIVLLTSSMSGEGKSFIATNLALTYALSNKKVLLVELDLRKPKISYNLKLNNDTGFSNYVISEINIDSIIQPSGVNDNLFVLGSGPIPPNPAELLLSSKVRLLFEQLRQKFDFIIIDAPPVGLVTDALIASEFSDANLYVVRAKYTFKGQLAIANELMASGKMKQVYFILNDADLDRSRNYHYGYGYGYGYYAEDAKKKSWWKRK
jgi:capsular exopolysaccharide synthesis family protein